jgi:N-sulfoglucosamine sulfohydrolase
VYDKTLFVFTADHGMAFPGGKTTVYEAGLRVPFVVRNPYEEKRGVHSQAMISHIDITPSLLDFAGGLDAQKNAPAKWVDPRTFARGESGPERENRNGGHPFKTYHGKSWISILADPDATHWETIFGSHTFHEIQMYYPMRTIRDGQYKLIWNIAHGLPYPFASDLWAASTWQAQFQQGKTTPYGLKTVGDYIHRPAFELYDLRKDPNESENLAFKTEYAEVLKKYQEKIKQFQKEMDDPWIMKWDYE